MQDEQYNADPVRQGRRAARPHYGTKRRVDTSGYVHVWDPAHPIAMAFGYVLEHRKVAWDAGLLTDPDLHVHHINGDKQDNRIENLAVLTCADHTRRHRDERRRTSDTHPQSPLTSADVQAMRRELAAGRRQVDVAAAYGVSQAVVSRIKRRETWAHVPDAPSVMS